MPPATGVVAYYWLRVNERELAGVNALELAGVNALELACDMRGGRRAAASISSRTKRNHTCNASEAHARAYSTHSASLILTYVHMYIHVYVYIYTHTCMYKQGRLYTFT